ncbi:MAG: hemolysin family protein [Gammaproteobacteria bacterium]
MDITLWSEVVLFIVLMLLSGFFSSSETSLFSLNKIQMEQMRLAGNPRTGLIERLLSQPRRLIVTILIGNEFVNVAASVISAAIVIRLLGAENKFVNLFIMVPILLLVGEITPKTLAIRNNAAFASLQSRPIEFFAIAISPLRWLVRLVADRVTTLFVGRERVRANIVTEDMVRTLAREAVGEGVLDPVEAQYIDHIFDFGNKTVADLMTPRSNIFYLPADMPLAEVVSELRRTRHTKVPVYGEHRDDIIGILYARDLLGLDTGGGASAGESLRRLLREPYFVPESKPASGLFHAFRKRRQSLALTVDEYGGVTGLISMEDLLECIFGDLPSASDLVAGPARSKPGRDGACVEGSLPIGEFNRRFGARLPEQAAETIGGLVLDRYAELPEAGSVLVIGDLEFVVEKTAGNRIQELGVRNVRAQPDQGARVNGREASDTGVAGNDAADAGLEASTDGDNEPGRE